MKRPVLAVLILLAIPAVLFASSYGKPYGASDETASERSDVKTIDQLNRSTDFEDPAEAVEQEPVPVENDPEPPAVEDSVADENQPPPAEEQEYQENQENQEHQAQ